MRILLLFFLITNAHAHGSSHPESHRHEIVYYSDIDGNPYLSTYDREVVVSVVNKVHLKRGYVESRYILPSEFKQLMVVLPQGFKYTGYLTDRGSAICDSKEMCFTPYTTAKFSLLKEALFGL